MTLHQKTVDYSKYPTEKLAYTFLESYIGVQFPNYRFSPHNFLISQKLRELEAGNVRRLMIFMPPRHGKMLSDSTDLQTPDGLRKHGDLKVGDYVFSYDGKPTKITWIAPKTLATLEVEFTNGEKIKCHENHEWLVWDRSYGEWKIYETKYFVKTTKFGKQRKLFSGNRFTYQLPLIKPLEFQEQNLLLHPYALGAWLGDGQSSNPRICASYRDEIVLRAVAACGYTNGNRQIHNTTGVIYQYYKDGMLGKLRNLNVLNNKHVPKIYKYSSIEQRLQLLAGLIDTDGSVDKKTNRIRIATGDPVLANDIKELVRSFGWHVCHYKQQPCTSTSGIIGKKEISYIGFQPTFQIPTKIPRKKIKRFAPQRRNSIKSVIRCDPEPGNSISVDRPDGLYLVGKTLIPTHNTMQVSEFFPAWYLGRNPSHQVIAATYSYDRAGDIGRKVRNQLIDPVHQFVFPDCHIASDSKGANKLSTKEGGHYYSVGVGGAIVGRGANLFIIDDPIKSREDAESLTSRKKMIEWFRAVAYTRLMPDNRIVMVMTRWHFDDLAGRLLEDDKENWETLSLPAIAESEDELTGRKIGDALWESDYPVSTLDDIKISIGSREWNAQYQQRPLDEEGGMIKLKWFKRYDEREFSKYEIASFSRGAPPIDRPFGIHRIVMSWDTAFKESELNDPSSCTVWGISKLGYYLLYVYNKRMGFPELKKVVIRLWERYMRYEIGVVGVLVEDRASGQSLIQVLNVETQIPTIAIRPDANKVIRMDEVSPIIEAGHVHLPENAPWLIRYETQMAQFPLGREDDDVDSTTQFLRWVSKPKYKRSKLRRFWK